jgi:hypothetical protein
LRRCIALAQHREFVAAEAGNRVTRTHDCLEALSHRPEH